MTLTEECIEMLEEQAAVALCDWEPDPDNDWKAFCRDRDHEGCAMLLTAANRLRERDQIVQTVIEEIYTTGSYDFKNGSRIDIRESGVFKDLADVAQRYRESY